MNALSQCYAVHAGSGSLSVAPTVSKEQVMVAIEILKKNSTVLRGRLGNVSRGKKFLYKMLQRF